MLNPETPADVGKTSASPMKSMRGKVAAAFVVLLAASVALGLWLRTDPFAQPLPIDDDDPEPFAGLVNPGYVGVKACAECHAKRVEEFQKTRHFVSCLPSSGAAAPGFTPGRGVHTTRDPNLHFEMKRTGDKLLLNGVQSAPQGQKNKSYDVALVYGAAGKSDEMYFVWHGDRLFVHPVGWLYPLDRWGHAAENINARNADSRCLECHNTWIAHAPGTPNQYRQEDMILGVSCERCHGPGREHVAHHRANPNADAHAILHPGQLSRERQIEVCTQCHSTSFRRRGPAFSYRPGEPLEDFVRVSPTKYPEDDLVANQIQYLRQSKCFQKSEMTCVDCHDPHRPHDHAASSKSCFKCHTAASCKDQPNLPAAVRGDCASCHMPTRTWMGAHFHTTDDQYVPVTARSEHRIAVYPEGKKAVLLAWLRTQADAKSRAEAERLAVELGKHWLKEGEQRRSEARLWGTMRALRDAVKFDPNPTARQKLQEAVALQAEFDRLNMETNFVERRTPDETIGLLNKILKIKPDHAKSHGKLGTMFAITGKRAEAIAHFQAVSKYDHDDAYGVTMLASLALLDGKADEAVALCKKADQIEPYDARIHHLWGMALLKQERWAEASERFAKVLKIDPKHVGGSVGMSAVLRHEGKMADAVRHARRAVRWSEEKNADALLELADAYIAAGQSAIARATLEQALSVASATNPPLVPAIQARLRDLP